jgi:aryl-alcohol dehydrogenase-like predicted oxidoreductase
LHYKKLGKTDLKVSRICLGTMNFGNQVSESEAINIIDNALERGVNFIDTADVYAEKKSEEIIGRALRDKRNSVVLATKVANRTGPDVNDVGLSRKHIMQAIHESLRRLKTDYIDLYYAHLPDYDTPLEETLRAMDDLVHEGKVRYIACSNFRAWYLCRALWLSDIHNTARFECIQSPYNIITRDIEYELLPLCISEEVGVCVYNPLAGGLLSGKHELGKPPADGTRFAISSMGLGRIYQERYWSDQNFEAITRLKQITETHDKSLVEFALAWIQNNKAITSVICGVSSVKQLQDNLKATETKLSEEELSFCDQIWQQLSPTRFSYGTQELRR